MSMADRHIFDVLAKEKYLSLVTFRRSGDAAPTPVWFALDSGTIYVESGPESGKVKRVRHTPRVTVAPCTLNGTVTGPALDGQGRIVTDQAEIAAAQAALTRAYPLTRTYWYGFLNILRILRRKPKVALTYLAITPTS
jgi:PPOX class probable F420-dependent enzyme